MKGNANALDRALKALADPTRARIVSLLGGGEICVCHIHEALRITQTKASRHLAYLRRAGLVAAEKRGQWVYYRLVPQADPLVETVCATVRHCLAHLNAVGRDAARLRQGTGKAVVPPPVPALRCCSG